MDAMIDALSRSADISECGKYRYCLERWWGSGNPVTFIMLNPSTADADVDDPTIRRCINFADAWGLEGLIVVNLFAWRATSPKDIPAFRQIATGPRNDEAIKSAVHRTTTVVCAWGEKGGLHNQDEHVLRMIRPLCSPKALALTKGGQPRHPLYLPGSLSPTPF